MGTFWMLAAEAAAIVAGLARAVRAWRRQQSWDQHVGDALRLAR